MTLVVLVTLVVMVVLVLLMISDLGGSDSLDADDDCSRKDFWSCWRAGEGRDDSIMGRIHATNSTHCPVSDTLYTVLYQPKTNNR